MSTFRYLIKRIFIVIYLFSFRKYKIFSNIFYKRVNNKQINKVLFYFPDAVMMHLGDHLFFEPISRLFKENKVSVAVAPVKVMSNYFRYTGYKIVENVNFSDYDLIVSSTRFINKLIRLNVNVILVRTEFPQINNPLINNLLDKFSVLFSFQNVVSAKPLFFDYSFDGKKYGLNPNFKYILYNNYLVSGSFRVNNSKFKKLEIFLLNFIKKHPEFEVIHTGSKKDYAGDNKNYHFVDIDLRGKTTVDDLFGLSALDNVIYYIGFDGFLMHLFFLQNKKAFVMSRGRWSKKSKFFLENYIDPPFYVKDVSMIKEYIR